MLSKRFSSLVEIFFWIRVSISVVAFMADLDACLRWMKTIDRVYRLSGHYWGVNESRIMP
jgi:hypothetical protein